LIDELKMLCGRWLDDSNAEYVKDCAKRYWRHRVTSARLLFEIIDLMFEYEFDMFKVFKEIEKKDEVINNGEVKRCLELYGEYIGLSLDDIKCRKLGEEHGDVIAAKVYDEQLIDTLL